ncbi:cytochrome c-type biogenesis protein [Roseospira visakhapatnamensis]|uniref:Cytochrome c-type biogenesis protein n=1 Tax=Roseospira visakhapatnamensis TaxID=390880 RepID=A0A7W6WB69_9PROT|nr:cytochrome c-type biogenesis protein [Roseospira visakhapatnamensis]MBB4267212.1 cytochrome c-type biogenesis protein CcmH [Roseospira visakhapatnamensis]
MRRGRGAALRRTALQAGAVAALLLGALIGGAPGAGAVEPDEMLDDPALEERAREVSADLRCVVCQNESIDESNADMARDMRILVRDRLLAGDSNEDVKQYLVDRYGDFVLLRPPFKPTTWLLWLGPALILAGGGIAAWSFYRRRAAEAPAVPAALSDREQARLRALLDDADGGTGDTDRADGAGDMDRAGPGGRA